MSDALVRNDAHLAEALDNLISQFEDKDNFQKLLKIIIGKIQELEDQFWLGMAMQTIAHATGAWLDKIGANYKETRNGQLDPAFRVRIYARISANKSRGRISDIETALGAGVHVRTYNVAHIRQMLIIADNIIADISAFRSILKQVRSSGVMATIIQTASAPAFRFGAPFPNGLNSGKLSTVFYGA